MAEVDFDKLVAIAHEAGDLAMRDWQAGEKAKKTWEKSPGQVVSDADIAVDHFLRERLEDLVPSAGWLSEETHIDHSGAGDDLTWVVDPIDGTKDFVAGRPGWCVSVALVQNGAPVFGILNAPAMEELWVAKAGSHTEVNGKPLSASVQTAYDGCRIPAENLPAEINLTAVPKPNSIALRMAMVADDRADMVASTRWGHEWDIAAAHVIAEQAGARVTDALGQKLAYNGTHGKALGVLCCSAGIYETAVARIAKYAANADGQP
ncbi:3'(2'),5'-bisphosphate nucleotidase CysQ [Parasphingorhabdus sp.]|uniref:3'(2'),5'-bisphosphate nucleotidase CysQ n=2 Tax=Parasphingorhabdus sp. TaxID=2709688 RepID=UPI0032630CDB